MYTENPKTKGSGIVCCIPQDEKCPVGCDDCFFQSGRSYLEPLEDNLPNMPDSVGFNQIVRVNDGNDSSNQITKVIESTIKFRQKFYNTSFQHIGSFPGPVVLTINPGHLTNNNFYKIHPAKNLMFVRFRTNTWNIKLAHEAVDYYTSKDIPVVLTFMAYHEKNENISERFYEYRKRTLNSYWAIRYTMWSYIMAEFRENPLVHSCGTEGVSTLCKHCGNCVREYHATMERMAL